MIKYRIKIPDLNDFARLMAKPYNLSTNQINSLLVKIYIYIIYILYIEKHQEL